MYAGVFHLLAPVASIGVPLPNSHRKLRVAMARRTRTETDKRQRLEECGCCACAFRITALQEEDDFDAAKEALHRHIRHLVVAGQTAAAAALAHTFEAEVCSTSEL